MTQKIKILLDNGHGEETPGKRSPDGKFREYRYAREIAAEVCWQLVAAGYDAERIVPESSDISLAERCRRVNAICDRLGKNNVILVSIHCNAAGNGGQWMSATGWAAYTSPGVTMADRLADCLYASAKSHLPSHQMRTDYSDGDADFEERFYILRHTKCAAVLTENLFQDNRADVDFLISAAGRQAIVDLHVDGIINYLDNV